MDDLFHCHQLHAVLVRDGCVKEYLRMLGVESPVNQCKVHVMESLTGLVNVYVDVAISLGLCDVVIPGSSAPGQRQLLVRRRRQVVWSCRHFERSGAVSGKRDAADKQGTDRDEHKRWAKAFHC